MVVGGAPEENETHVKDIAQGEHPNFQAQLTRTQFAIVHFLVALSFLEETAHLKESDGLVAEIRTG